MAQKPLDSQAPNEGSESKPGSTNPWADAGERWEDVAQREAPASPPAALRPGGAFVTMEQEEEMVWGEAKKRDPLDGAPAYMRPGGERAETNPFLRKKVSESAESLSKEPSNPWSPVREPTLPSSGLKVPENAPTQLPPSLPPKDIWDNPTPPPAQSPALISLPSRSESPAWDEDPLGKNKAAAPMTVSDELTDETHVWDDLGSKGKAKAIEEWNLIDAEPSEPTEAKPPLPPRRSTDIPAWKPSRQQVDGAETYQVKNIKWYDSSAPKNPRTSPILIQNANGPCPLVALVNALTLTTPAEIPDTALVQILRSREQVSLNLLLDAVFDELMSPRRTSSEDALPDVSDLYAFLQSLHTGMNVNPRFIPTEQMIHAYKRTSLTHLHPTERGDLIPGTFENTAEMSLYATFSIPLIHGWLPPKSEPAYEALGRQAASYEDAQNLLFREEELEDKLSNSEAGLDETEQQLYQDIQVIKSFLVSSATQLTHWGIEVIGRAIRPGTFAILFRNDHFSTLYCHPETMQLLTLVTDAGFKTHDDIVWETLSDVNGESTEFLSGDFRMVGTGVVLASSADNDGEWTTVQRRGKACQEEEPMSPSTEQEDRDLALALQLQEEEDERHREAEARRRRESILSEQYIEQQGRQPGPGQNPGRGTGQGLGQGRGVGGPREGAGLVPARSSSNVATQSRPTQQVRSLIPPQQQGVTGPGVTRLARPGVNRSTEEGDDAPPSYEQAAHDVAYQPPMGHPSHATSSPSVSRQSTRTSINTPIGQRPMGRTAAGRPVPAMGNGGSSRERECSVM
ncbi:hypothetical protein B0J13DRAFT_507766 [Dactylonectria estremocensis]|uniref:MINDY deubiquitinase domain-containing protein n=1 Tax=Dactylonectria estremocensis TaxID=1079267 RepID=A0A9P9E909_9HYPO|nr:hypothetical protein B0J13DRAFT_507766 [Dactylonectria estremocensis]